VRENEQVLSDDKKQEVSLIVDRALDKAERIWGKHGLALDEAIRADSVLAKGGERVSSRIPGQKEVEAGKECVGTFIALVADIRGSSNHLLVRIGDAKATELERVFYETSALLPALERTIQFNDGAATEYLGDGLLAFFEVDEADKETAVSASYAAAKNCIGDTRNIVNQALKSRYSLPPLDIGIGMAMSKAVVSLVGIEGNSHAKVTGRCVYYATKLADGKNQIIVDEWMDAAWPTVKGGGLQFELRTRRGGVKGYLVKRKTG
jgi:class 3 adenylate cyclase